MGRMCFWNGTIDTFRIFLGNCLIGDHLDQTNIKEGISSITLIFICSYINQRRGNSFLSLLTIKYTMASVQLVETYVTLHTTIHRDFRAVSRDICDSAHYSTPWLPCA